MRALSPKSRVGRLRSNTGKRRSRQKPQSGAARSPRSSRASARQSRVVDVLPLRLRHLRNRPPGGEHLDETETAASRA